MNEAESVRELLAALERRLDTLREADLQAIRLAHSDLSQRLEGFPQQFATKVEMEEASRAVQRLEKETLSREIYDQQHKTLADAVAKIDRGALSEATFNAFVDNYRREQEALAVERRTHAELLATGTDRVRRDLQDERSNYLTVDGYDLQHQEMVRSIQAVQRWQYKLVGGLVFATFVAPLVTATVVYLVTKEFA